MNELALFAGAGGGILGGYLLGWRTVCAVEIEDYPRKVLLARQRDGILPTFPIWDDITTFDGNEWRGRVDVVSVGFPCQDISADGKGEGLDGEKSGLWAEMARVIGEVQPKYVLVENSPMLTIRGIGRVLGDLATLGYDARWGVLGADDAGGNHIRKRIWIIANAVSNELRQHETKQEGGEEAAGSLGHPPVFTRLYKSYNGQEKKRLPNNSNPWKASPWDEATPKVCGMDDELANRVDRMRAIGNGQVPAVVRLAWEVLSE